MPRPESQIPSQQESLVVFRRGPELIDAALSGVTDDESRFVPSPRAWTIRQVARHVADTEIVAGMRLRQIIAEDRPLLATFDQDLWADRLRYNGCDVFDSARKFRVLREDISAILESLPDAAFERVALHPERGAETLGIWVARLGSHVESHAAQIRRIRQSWSNR